MVDQGKATNTRRKVCVVGGGGGQGCSFKGALEVITSATFRVREANECNHLGVHPLVAATIPATTHSSNIRFFSKKNSV